MPILANAQLTTARGVYTASTQSTSAPQPRLTGILAHIGPIRASQMMTLPADAVNWQYVALVDTGIDIVAGDILTKITLLDGITPWPTPINLEGAWWVRHTQEQAPLILPARMLFLAYVQAGGPAQ